VGAFVSSSTTKRAASVEIGITGKYAELRDAYASIEKSLEHCGAHLGCDIEERWIETTMSTTAPSASGSRASTG
jgi:CTP synthase